MVKLVVKGYACLGIREDENWVSRKNLVSYLVILSSRDCISQHRMSALVELLAIGAYCQWGKASSYVFLFLFIYFKILICFPALGLSCGM